MKDHAEGRLHCKAPQEALMAALISCLVFQLNARLVSRSSLEQRVQQAAFSLDPFEVSCVSPTDLSRLQDPLS